MEASTIVDDPVTIANRIRTFPKKFIKSGKDMLAAPAFGGKNEEGL